MSFSKIESRTKNAEERSHLTENLATAKSMFEYFIGNELLFDSKCSLHDKGFQDLKSILTPQDRILFEEFIKVGDEHELISKDEKEKVRVNLTSIEFRTVTANQEYEVMFTLGRSN